MLYWAPSGVGGGLSMVLAWPVLPAGVNEKGWVVVGILSHRLYIEDYFPLRLIHTPDGGETQG